MMKKLKNAFACVAMILSLFLALTAYAQSSEEGLDKMAAYKGGRSEDFIEELNLTPQQQEQVKQQRSANKKRWEELREKLFAKRLELRQELEKAAVDKNKVNGLVAEIKTLMGQQLQERVDDIIAMKKILTPEQFKKMQDRKTRR